MRTKKSWWGSGMEKKRGTSAARSWWVFLQVLELLEDALWSHRRDDTRSDLKGKERSERNPRNESESEKGNRERHVYMWVWGWGGWIGGLGMRDGSKEKRKRRSVNPSNPKPLSLCLKLLALSLTHSQIPAKCPFLVGYMPTPNDTLIHFFLLYIPPLALVNLKLI